MSKYIDADKLIAEIEKRRDKALERQKNLENIGQETVLNEMIAFELNKILSFIDSLQQEQPECIYGRTLEEREKCCKFCSAFCKARIEQEQPEVDLEKFTEKIKTFQGRYKYPEILSIKGAMAFMARMFYQYPNAARQWYDRLPKTTMD